VDGARQNMNHLLENIAVSEKASKKRVDVMSCNQIKSTFLMCRWPKIMQKSRKRRYF
jgi:hypothetical protein